MPRRTGPAAYRGARPPMPPGGGAASAEGPRPPPPREPAGRHERLRLFGPAGPLLAGAPPGGVPLVEKEASGERCSARPTASGSFARGTAGGSDRPGAGDAPSARVESVPTRGERQARKNPCMPARSEPAGARASAAARSRVDPRFEMHGLRGDPGARLEGRGSPCAGRTRGGGECIRSQGHADAGVGREGSAAGRRADGARSRAVGTGRPLTRTIVRSASEGACADSGQPSRLFRCPRRCVAARGAFPPAAACTMRAEPVPFAARGTPDTGTAFGFAPVDRGSAFERSTRSRRLRRLGGRAAARSRRKEEAHSPARRHDAGAARYVPIDRERHPRVRSDPLRRTVNVDTDIEAPSRPKRAGRTGGGGAPVTAPNRVRGHAYGNHGTRAIAPMSGRARRACVTPTRHTLSPGVRSRPRDAWRGRSGTAPIRSRARGTRRSPFVREGESPSDRVRLGTGWNPTRTRSVGRPRSLRLGSHTAGVEGRRIEGW